MSNFRNSIVHREPGRSDGCPDGKDKQPHSQWVCTDHFDWQGETLHVAGASHAVVGAWLDADRSWIGNHASGITTFAELRSMLENDPKFFPRVSAKELKAAAKRLQKMLEEMSQ